MQNEIDTNIYAITQPNDAASTSHTRTPLPKNGAIQQAIPQRIIAASGVLFLPSLPNIFGIISDSPMEYSARLPPIKNEFQEVMIPHRPPIMRTLPMSGV